MCNELLAVARAVAFAVVLFLCYRFVLCAAVDVGVLGLQNLS